MSPPKIVHAPACDRKTASASAVFVHFQRRKKFFHGSTLISHSTGHPKTGIPSADNGAKPGHGYSGVKRHSPCQRRTPSDALIAVALHPGAGHCSTDPMLSVRCRRRYSHCCVVLIICLYAQIILCNSISLLLYAILLVLSMNFLLQKDFLCVDYFASTSLHDLSSPAPWSAT